MEPMTDTMIQQAVGRARRNCSHFKLDICTSDGLLDHRVGHRLHQTNGRAHAGGLALPGPVLRQRAGAAARVGAGRGDDHHAAQRLAEAQVQVQPEGGRVPLRRRAAARGGVLAAVPLPGARRGDVHA
eukprot:1194281-Prorocentrum_minimum.AAC.10